MNQDVLGLCNFPLAKHCRPAFRRTDTSTSISTTNVSFKFRSTPWFTIYTRWMCKCDDIDALRSCDDQKGSSGRGAACRGRQRNETHVVPVTWRPPTSRRRSSDERRFAPGGIGDAPLLTSCSPAGGPVSGPHSSEGWDVAIHGGLLQSQRRRPLRVGVAVPHSRSATEDRTGLHTAGLHQQRVTSPLPGKPARVFAEITGMPLASAKRRRNAMASP